MRAIARDNSDIGHRINGIALVNQTFQSLFWISCLQQGTIGALTHTAQQHIGIRLEPNRNARLCDFIAGRLLHVSAAARSQHQLALG